MPDADGVHQWAVYDQQMQWVVFSTLIFPWLCFPTPRVYLQHMVHEVKEKNFGNADFKASGVELLHFSSLAFVIMRLLWLTCVICIGIKSFGFGAFSSSSSSSQTSHSSWPLRQTNDVKRRKFYLLPCKCIL